MVWLGDGAGLRDFLERAKPLEPKRREVPTKASAALRAWFEGAHDGDLFYVLALLERFGPAAPATLAALFEEVGADDAASIAALDAPHGVFELCETARSPNLLFCVVATRAHHGRGRLVRAWRKRGDELDAAALAAVLKGALGLPWGRREAGALIRRVGEFGSPLLHIVG